MAKKSQSTTNQRKKSSQASSMYAPPVNSMPEVSMNPYAQNDSKMMFGIQVSTIILILVFFVGGFFIGSMWKENQMLKAGTGGTKNAAAVPVDAGTAPTVADDSGVNFAKFPEITDADHVRGNENARIQLVEYSDFECPFCARFHPTTSQILEEYGDQVSLIYRHYPLSFHPNAQKAAEGAECVAKQRGSEAFWAYADALFEVNSATGKLTPEAITEAAAGTGVDMTQFQTCLDSGEMATLVSSQMAAGSAAGVQGTPGTFVVVDGEAVDFIGGALPFDQVKTTLDSYVN